MFNNRSFLKPDDLPVKEKNLQKVKLTSVRLIFPNFFKKPASIEKLFVFLFKTQGVGMTRYNEWAEHSKRGEGRDTKRWWLWRLDSHASTNRYDSQRWPALWYNKDTKVFEMNMYPMIAAGVNFQRLRRKLAAKIKTLLNVGRYICVLDFPEVTRKERVLTNLQFYCRVRELPSDGTVREMLTEIAQTITDAEELILNNEDE